MHGRCKVLVLSDSLPDLPGGSFYQRYGKSDIPTVAGRTPRYEPRCRVCTMVVRLTDEMGYSEDEALKAEEDVYRMIYLFWDASSIAEYMIDKLDYQISHDSISTHIRNHIPDPSIAFYDRVRSYRPSYMTKKSIQDTAETMMFLLMQFQRDLVSGQVEIKPSDFIQVAKLMKEWKEELSGSDVESQIMGAVGRALQKSLPDQESVNEFKKAFREELKQIEDTE